MHLILIVISKVYSIEKFNGNLSTIIITNTPVETYKAGAANEKSQRVNARDSLKMTGETESLQ